MTRKSVKCDISCYGHLIYFVCSIEKTLHSIAGICLRDIGRMGGPRYGEETERAFFFFFLE